ncbi:hypothetical protein FisN_11Hh069 [Fistulifera solaris]|jgi:hypothetical protein|uniref:Uncharacterized protein n=1 Tax=Fistulifera solaris TaxID=1519565 RepID=A0A1Z5JKC5_FISSO|nr:hypothetical protein FisN_11Hh069 [Fistulifera solaris]|eukprot:GAX14470.1 hypothetical protein FisN_11Hh069 [Fistulifera solaris]
METTKPKRIRFYEQLGAPSLLFRNGDACNVDVDFVSDDFGPSVIEDFWEERERRSRAQACFYYKIEQPKLKVDLRARSKVIAKQRKRKNAHRHMSFWMKEGSEHLTFDKPHPAKEVNHFKTKLSTAQVFESAYLRSHLIAYKPSTSRGIRRPMVEFSTFMATLRRDHGDPNYMAPFPKEEDYQLMNTKELKRAKHRRLYSHPFGENHPNRPSLYGNCLICFHCVCSRCNGQKDPTICLLHPVGEECDKLRLSFISLPHGPRRENAPETTEDGPDMQLNLGESIRQLRQCGSETFMARTALFCVFFRVSLDEQETHGNLVCGSCYKLSLLHKVDLRTLSKFAPSYIPASISCHPKYGLNFSNPRSAILSVCQKTGDRVTVYLAQCDDQEVPITKHRFNNLHDISYIEFTMNHPMVLWSAARSHIHPITKVSIDSQDHQFGFGNGLFCLDARSQQAIFQWSPSREEFVAEGVHGLSGIHVDEKMPYSLWVSSFSAGKVWEIDSRMPSTPVTTWSLAHACNGLGAVLPPTGLYGAGHLFSRPIVSSFYENQKQAQFQPLLSVSQDPGAFSLNVYQRPFSRPRFATRPVECTPDPNLSRMKGLNVASSSMFSLPERSDKVFVTGLVSFDVSPTRLLTVADLVRIGYADENEIDAFCAVTMNNQGDLHMYTVMDGRERECSLGMKADSPVGGGFIALPQQVDAVNQNDSVASHTLVVRLGNDSPDPVSAFALPTITHDMRSLAKSCEKLGSFSMPSQEAVTLEEQEPDGHLFCKNENMLFSFVVVDQSKQPSALQSPPQTISDGNSEMKSMEENFFLPFRLQDFDEKDVRSRSDMSFEAVEKVSDVLRNWGDYEGND